MKYIKKHKLVISIKRIFHSFGLHYISKNHFLAKHYSWIAINLQTKSITIPAQKN